MSFTRKGKTTSRNTETDVQEMKKKVVKEQKQKQKIKHTHQKPSIVLVAISHSLQFNRSAAETECVQIIRFKVLWFFSL